MRAVAQELAGTGVALGLLPGGTGNLLARNLDVPVSSISEAMEVVLDGLDRVIDLGWLDLDGERHAFTVMAGLGFDAKIMDDAPEGVKARVGWAAYVMSASKHLGDNSFQASITIDAGESESCDARTVIVGNCGTLTGGIVLLPDAVIDDGLLDVAILTPQSLADWTALAGRVLVGKEADGPSIERLQAGRWSTGTCSRRHPGHDQHRSRHPDRPRSTVRNGAPPPGCEHEDQGLEHDDRRGPGRTSRVGGDAGQDEGRDRQQHRGCRAGYCRDDLRPRTRAPRHRDRARARGHALSLRCHPRRLPDGHRDGPDRDLGADRQPGHRRRGDRGPAPPATSRFGQLFLFWLGATSFMEGAGYLVITPMGAGDTAATLAAFDLPLWVGFPAAALGSR